MAYMSQEGYDKLIAELQRLESVERPKASAAIAEAREKGDLSENSEYDAAKEAQAHLEDKINRLKVTISEAKVVDTSRLSTDTVQILTKVEMTNLTTKSKMSYTVPARFLSRLLLLKDCWVRRWVTRWKSKYHAAPSNFVSRTFQLHSYGYFFKDCSRRDTQL